MMKANPKKIKLQKTKYKKIKMIRNRKNRIYKMIKIKKCLDKKNNQT